MRKIELKSNWKTTVVLAAGLGLGGGVVFAQKAPLPTNQREFDGATARLSATQIDAVGHAFDNGVARLFWFTDLEKAKAQAKLENKPILSLRLLGNLTDEYSCANSRFFRVIFYPQAQINPLLREKFVLHWSRERPVPLVTIDMGDGRKIKRTLTGNSAHYLLDSSGRPLDVMPSVVTPARFAAWLENGAKLNEEFAQTAPEKRDEFLSNWHRLQMTEAWHELNPRRQFPRQNNDDNSNDVWVEKQVARSIELNPLEKTENTPRRFDASLAAPLATVKSAGEIPILDATRLFNSSLSASAQAIRLNSLLPIEASPNNPVLDDATKAKIKAMKPLLTQPEVTDLSKSPFVNRNWTAQAQLRPQLPENAPKVDAFDTLIAGFETSIRGDEKMSLARFQIPIHASFVEGKVDDFTSLNRKIYDRLFLTPKSDPWLGLAADGVFTGLQNGGIVEAKKDSAE